MNLVTCWVCKRLVPEDETVCMPGVGTQCRSRETCRPGATRLAELTAERDQAIAAANAMRDLMAEQARQARARGLTYEAIRDLVGAYESEEISFGKLVEDLRALALHAAPSSSATKEPG